MAGNGGASPTDPRRSPFCLRFPPALQSRHVTHCTAARIDCHRRARPIPPLDGPGPSGDAGAAQPANVLIDAIGVGITAGVGSFLSVFLVRLGATDFQVGLLTAMPALTGMLLAMPAGEFLSRRTTSCPGSPAPASWYSSATCSPAWRRSSSATAAPGDHPDLGAGDPAANVGLGGFHGGDGGGRRSGRPLHADEPALGDPGVVHSLTVLIVGQVLKLYQFPLNYQMMFIGSAVGALISVVFSSSIKLPPRQRAARGSRFSLAQMSGESGVGRPAPP